MTLEQLRIFVAVAERQHVTQAAKALNLTQSAVSAAVTTLETRHGVTLFDRVGRSVVLNATGLVFLEEARAVLARAQAAESALDDLAGLRRGVLSIHASQTIASYWLPSRLAAFHAAYPGIRLDIAIGNTADVAKTVLAGTAELGLVEGQIADPMLFDQIIDHDRLVLVVGRDHPWARVRPTREPDLTDTAWVLREVGSGTRWATDGVLHARGLTVEDLDIAMVLPDNEAASAAVVAGAGASILGEAAAASGLARGGLVEIPLNAPARAFRLLRHRQRYRSRAGDAFVSWISSQIVRTRRTI
jgi:DNA-binding transcriptional LysR family regulator